MQTQEYFRRALIEGIETREIPISTEEVLSFIAKLAQKAFNKNPDDFCYDEFVDDGLPKVHYTGHFTRARLESKFKEKKLPKTKIDTIEYNSWYDLKINEELLWNGDAPAGFLNSLNGHLPGVGDKGIFAFMSWGIPHPFKERKKFIEILDSIGYTDFRDDNEGIFAYHPSYRGILRVPTNVSLEDIDRSGYRDFKHTRVNNFINCFYWQRS